MKFLKMKTKFVVFILSITFFGGCENNSRVDCSTVLCAQQVLSIELLDTEGVNLIANETYSLENIKVFKDSIQVSQLGNTMNDAILIAVFGEEGNNTYDIFLDASETDILELELSKNNPGSECCSPLFTIEKATYNGADLEIIREPSDIEKIIVIK